MYLTYIGAAERPHRDVRAGVKRSLCRDAREGMHAVLGETIKLRLTRPRHPWWGARRDEDTLSVFVCFRLALLNPAYFQVFAFLKLLSRPGIGNIAPVFRQI